MSQNDISPIALQIGLNAKDYVCLVSLAILYYDYLLTLSMEVERFWSIWTFSWASFFFFFNRYLSLLGHIPVVFEFFWTSSDITSKANVCFGLQTYHQFLLVALQLAVVALLSLRTYALYDCKRYALIILVTTAGCGVAFGCWAIISSKRVHPPVDSIPFIGCETALTRDSSIRLGAAWSGVLLFDTLIFFMTLYKSFYGRWSGDLTLLNALVRDGSLYYAVMVLVNVWNILMFFVAPLYLSGLGATFTTILSSTLISRLVLRLRDPSLSTRSPSQTRFEVHRQSEAGAESGYQVSTIVVPDMS